MGVMTCPPPAFAFSLPSLLTSKEKSQRTVLCMQIGCLSGGGATAGSFLLSAEEETQIDGENAEKTLQTKG